MPDFTAEDIRKYLSYDPETGLFTWIIDRPNARAGKVCTAKNKGGYVVIGFQYAYHSAHRLAWLYMTGAWPAGEIDHIDRNRSNNKWSNLRVTDRAGNMHNARIGRTNMFGLHGVTYNKKNRKYQAEIRAYGRRIFLGQFDTPAAANNAYQSAKASMHLPVPNQGQIPVQEQLF